MKALIIESYGEQPQYVDRPSPSPQPNQLLVNVLAASLHPIVKGIANGDHYSSINETPFIPGLDGVGTLDDGKRVYFRCCNIKNGSMAQQSLTRTDLCTTLPNNLDSYVAAATFNPGLSSWLALTYRANIQPGDNILINGATGYAGRLAIMVAKHLGAGSIIVTGRNENILSELTPLGASHTISLNQPRTELITNIIACQANQPIDIILDYLWGEPATAVLSAAAKQANTATRFIQIGDTAGKTIELPSSILRSSNITLIGSGIGPIPNQIISDAATKFAKFASHLKLDNKCQTAPLDKAPLMWGDTPKPGKRFVFTP